MSVAGFVAASSLLALAGLHSALGERLILGPLFAAESWPAVPLGRPFTQRTLRMAWHLTSVAWVGLAILVAGSGATRLVQAVVGGVLVVSGAIAYAATRGRHFAWVLFLAGGIAAAAGMGAFDGGGRAALAWASGGTFAAISLLHVAWASGMRWGVGAALPSMEGRPALPPPRWVTLLVALALALAAWLALGLGGRGVLPPPPLARWLGLAGALVLGARTVGDFSTMGILKRVRGTPFARFDDLLFTPLCFFLGASLLLLAVGA